MRVAFYNNTAISESIYNELNRPGGRVELCEQVLAEPTKLTKIGSYDAALINTDRMTDPHYLRRIIESCTSMSLPYVLLAHSLTFERTEIKLSASSHVEVVFPPHNPEEVLVRLKMAVERSHTNRTRSNFIVRGPLSIDPSRYEVSVNGKHIGLTYKEYSLLKFLAENAERVFTRETLLENVWGYDFFGGMRTVDVHVRRVRSKLGDVDSRLIETVRSVGYRFKVPIENE